MSAFPRALERQLLDEAERRYPDEAAGMIVRNGDRLTFVPGRNISATPQKTSRLHPDDLEAAERAGEIAFHFHSQTNERATPSPGDMTMSEKFHLPLVIASWPGAEIEFYFPTGWRAPLLGRPFVHGVLDCYTLIRDAFKERAEIDLPDFERPDDWWLDARDADGTIVRPHANLYLDNFAAAGFERNAADVPLQVLDCFLMQLGSQKDGSPVPPNHAAIWLGDGAILHHVIGRLSRIQPYHEDFGYYSRATYGVYRHRDMAGRSLPPWRIEKNSRGWPLRV